MCAVGDLVSYIGRGALRHTNLLQAPAGWQKGKNDPAKVDLVRHFSWKAQMAKRRLFNNSFHWIKENGKTYPNRQRSTFFHTLPDLDAPGTTLSAWRLKTKYENNPFELVKGMISLNDGAVAEISGKATELRGPHEMPRVARAYHVQFAKTLDQRDDMARRGLPGSGNRMPGRATEICVDEELMARDWIVSRIGSTTMQELMFDHEGNLKGFKGRRALVITLPELLEMAPPSFCSLFAVYCWWLDAPKIIKTKLHPSHFKKLIDKVPREIQDEGRIQQQQQAESWQQAQTAQSSSNKGKGNGKGKKNGNKRQKCHWKGWNSW